MEETSPSEAPPEPTPPETEDTAPKQTQEKAAVSAGLVERRLNTLKKRISGFLSNDSSDPEDEVFENKAIPEEDEEAGNGPRHQQTNITNGEDDRIPNGDVVVPIDDGDIVVGPDAVSPDPGPTDTSLPDPDDAGHINPYQNYATLMKVLGEPYTDPPTAYSDPPTAKIIDIDEELDHAVPDLQPPVPQTEFPTPPRSLIVDKDDDSVTPESETDDFPNTTPCFEQDKDTFESDPEVQEALDAMVRSVPNMETASSEWNYHKDFDGRSMPDSEGVALENVAVGIKAEESKKPKKFKRNWKLGFSDLGKDLFRACIAEALGVFFLILICVGCANSRILVQLSSTNNTVHLQPLYYLAISFAFGIGIGAIVHILSESSGGHVNPAVSLALFLDKRISFVCFLFYTIAQFAGGFAGAGVLYGIGNHGNLSTSIYGGNAYDNDEIEWYQAFAFEAFGTMFLVLTILATINEKRGHAPSYLQPLAIGLAIFVVHIWLIPYTNCGINPVRGTVWNIIIDAAGDQSLVFLFAPLIGAALAVPLFNFVFNPGYCS